MEMNELKKKERKDKGPKERREKAKEEKERRRKRGKLCSENLASEFSKKRRNSVGEIGEWIDFIVSSSSCFEF